MWYDEHMKDRLYYIVGVSLLVLLVLVVYVGSRVQNVELGLANVDSRLSDIEAQIEAQMDLVNTMGLDELSADQFGASVVDAYGYDPYYDYYATE